MAGRSAAEGLVLESYTWRRALPECNGDTCAFKARLALSRLATLFPWLADGVWGMAGCATALPGAVDRRLQS